MIKHEDHPLTFSLTAVYLEDNKTGRVTAFFAQFPEASSEGRNKEEAKELLYELFPVMLDDKKDELLAQTNNNPTAHMTYEQQKITA